MVYLSNGWITWPAGDAPPCHTENIFLLLANFLQDGDPALSHLTYISTDVKFQSQRADSRSVLVDQRFLLPTMKTQGKRLLLLEKGNTFCVSFYRLARWCHADQQILLMPILPLMEFFCCSYLAKTSGFFFWCGAIGFIDVGNCVDSTDCVVYNGAVSQRRYSWMQKMECLRRQIWFGPIISLFQVCLQPPHSAANVLTDIHRLR